MTKRISFSEAEKLSEIFDSDHREEWQNTSHIVASLNLKENTIIADVGAGTGYFSSLFSDQVPLGRVYAIDTEPNMVRYMNERFSHHHKSNIEIRQSSPTDPCLPEQVDSVFLANVYRFIEDRPAFLAILYQQVHHNTQVIFVDFKQVHARVSPDMAMNEVMEAGFRIKAMDQEGCPDHYILTFCKS